MAVTRTKVSISGIPELQKRVKELDMNMRDILVEAVLAGSDIVRDDAKSRARRKSGALASGIISTVTWDKNAPVAFAGAGMDRRMNDVFVKYSANGKRYYYPASIEYGHAKAPAYPFMRPAMDSNKNKIRKAVRDRVKAVVERMSRA